MDREKGLQKVDSLRKEKEALEMAECTFRPELYGRGNKSSKVMTFKAMVKKLWDLVTQTTRLQTFARSE